MMFSERGVAAELLARDIWKEWRVLVEDFINYCFFFISDYAYTFFRTYSAFFYTAA